MKRLKIYINEKLHLNKDIEVEKNEQYDVDEICNIIDKCLSSNFYSLSYDISPKSKEDIKVTIKNINNKNNSSKVFELRKFIIDEVNKHYDKIIFQIDKTFVNRNEIWLKII